MASHLTGINSAGPRIFPLAAKQPLHDGTFAFCGLGPDGRLVFLRILHARLGPAVMNR